MSDPTTAMIEAQNNERVQLRAENQRLREEIERVRDESFVAGYDQAVGEIHAHFAKTGEFGVVHAIATRWLKRSP